MTTTAICMDQKNGNCYRILESTASSSWWLIGYVNIQETDSPRQRAINCVYNAAHRAMGVRQAIIHLTTQGGEVLVHGSDYRPTYRSEDMGGSVAPLYAERRQIEVARAMLKTPLADVIAQLEDPAIEFEIDTEHYYIVPPIDG